jgi:hypothetical protein
MPRRGGGGGLGAAIEERCDALGRGPLGLGAGCARLQAVSSDGVSNSNEAQAA